MNKINNKNFNVLVVGSTGFVGRQLALEIKQRGFNLKATLRTSNQKFGDEIDFIVTGDLDSNFDWDIHMQGVTTVIYAAARVHIMTENTKNSLEKYRAINVDSAAHCANIAASSGVKRFIYISSIKVNGEFSELNKPFSSDQIPQPHDAYALSKLEAEIQLKKIGAETKMEVVIVRPPLIYGPGVRANFLQMLLWLKAGVPLPFGLIKLNKRSFIAIDNLVDLIITCIWHPNARNNIFLASDGNDVSTNELLLILSSLMKIPSRLFRCPAWLLLFIAHLIGRGRQVSRLVDSLQIDISQTCEKLNWMPPISMEEGLRRTVQDFLEKRSFKSAK